MQLTRQTHDDLIAAVEDSIAYTCQEAYEYGTPLSGEAAWTVVLCRAQAKIAEFQGQLASNA